MEKYYVIKSEIGDYMGEDNHSGGYIFWTDNIKFAKKFYSIEDLKEYYNPSFNCSIKYSVVEIKIKITQKEIINNYNMYKEKGYKKWKKEYGF